MVKGCADIIFSLGVLGNRSIKGVDFTSDLTLKGLNSLPEIKCTQVKEVIIHKRKGQEQTQLLEVSISLDIHNQSQLMLTLGDVTLSIYNATGPVSPRAKKAAAAKQFDDEGKCQMGTIAISSLTLLLGMNDSRTATLSMDPSQQKTRQFLINVAREPQTLYLRGFHGTSKNEALTTGLASLTTTVVIPTFHVPAHYYK